MRERERDRERETERDRETEREAFTLKAIVKIFQSQGYCSEVLSVWNYSEEIITKTSEAWNLLWCILSYYQGNAYYPAFSYFTGWSCLGIFFFQTHTLIV